MTALRKVPALRPSSFRLREHAVREWHVVLPETVTFDEAMVPEYWSIFSSRLGVGDEITLIANDGSFKAQVTVYDVGAGWAKMQTDWLRKAPAIALGDVEDDATAFRIRHRGFGNFEVIRKSDARSMSQHRTKEDAIAAMRLLEVRAA